MTAVKDIFLVCSHFKSVSAKNILNFCSKLFLGEKKKKKTFGGFHQKQSQIASSTRGQIAEARTTILPPTEQKPHSQKFRQNETAEKCLAPEKQLSEVSQSEKDNI